MGGPGSGGHNRKTAEAKALEGNPGKRPYEEPEPDPPVLLTEIPKPPRHLHRWAKQMWRRLAPLLVSNGTLAKTTEAIFANYCEAYATERVAQAELKNRGLTQVARHGMAPRPEVRIAKEARAQQLAFAKELGLTRPRAAVSGAPKEEPDPLDKLLRTRRKN